jgi:fructose-specific component phosphotransferase system IIB-like protein
MTEEKLASPPRKASKGRIIGLFLALFGILVLALWLSRQPLAEMIAQGVCRDQGLSCKLSVTRLDFGGLTLTSIDARAPGAGQAAASAENIVIDFVWDWFTPRPVAVTGDAITVRLDLTGRRSVLGDLEKAVQAFTAPSDSPAAPMPRLAVTNLVVIGETLSGPVTAKGRIVAAPDNSFTLEMDAPPTSLGLAGGTFELSAASLRARIAGETISAAVKLDLDRFVAEGTSLADIVIDATLEQSSGSLRGEGKASLGAIMTPEGTLSSATAEATLDSPAIAGEFQLSEWLRNVRKLDVAAQTGEGAFAGITWKTSTLAVNIAAQATGPGGAVKLSAENLRTAQASAGRVDVSGDVAVSGNDVTIINGLAETTAGMLSAQQRTAVSAAAADALEPVLPPFADALRRAIDRAGQSFTVRTPWSARISSTAMDVALGTGAELRSASGLVIRATAPQDSDIVGTFNAFDASWKAAGVVAMEGGGAPPLAITFTRAAGGVEQLAMAGQASLKHWKVGNDIIAAEFSDLDLVLGNGAGAAVGRLSIRLDGGLAGGSWTGARGIANVRARWDAKTFVVEAPEQAVISWDRASYGGAEFGAAALRYTPIGPLAQRSGDGLTGRGTLAPISMPVSGDGFSADVRLGATPIGWRTQGGFRANLESESAAVDLKLDERNIPIRIGTVSGQLDLTRGWKIVGKLANASAAADEAHITNLAAAFDLAGQGESLTGTLSGITARLTDPLEREKRFEPMDLRGDAHLNNSKADFTAAFRMAESGVQIAQVAGRHDLETGTGALTLEPTPFIFRPHQFQPSDLSPLLVGPANVTGRLDIAGSATWTPANFTAKAVLDLQKLGFVLASAGVFEGVSGHVEVLDLFDLRSLPGQRITIDKVTLGLPIENGTIDFQLVGFNAIQLESARWPFAGGYIRVDATEFKFASTAENRIVARADEWDLAVLVDQLKLPDMKLAGKVGGTFPVVFRTGSAEIDNARLKSTRPGVIQYTGDAGDAASEANEYSKMAFDALKDFNYEVLEVGLNGNLAGKMMLNLSVLGSNPDLLSGAPFKLNISIDSALVPLLTTTFQRPDLKTAIEQAQDQDKPTPPPPAQGAQN